MLDTVASLLIAREPGWPTSDPGGAVRTVTAPCAARPLWGHARRIRRQHIPPRTHGRQIKHKAQRPVVARVRPQVRSGDYILTAVAGQVQQDACRLGGPDLAPQADAPGRDHRPDGEVAGPVLRPS